MEMVTKPMTYERPFYAQASAPASLSAVPSPPHLTCLSVPFCLHESAQGSSALVSSGWRPCSFHAPPMVPQFERTPAVSLSHPPLMWISPGWNQPLLWALCMPSRMLAHGGHVINSCWHGVRAYRPRAPGFTHIYEFSPSSYPRK